MEDKKMKRTVNEGKGIVLGMAALMLMGTVFAGGATSVQAKTSEATKNSSSYEMSFDDDRDCNVVSNGKVVYFTKGRKLKKLTLKTMRIKNVASVKKTKRNDKNSPDALFITNTYGNQIFLVRNSWGSWKDDTFSYNIKSGKVKKLFRGYIENVDGKYVVVYKDFGSDVHTSRYDIYKTTKNGVKKVKRLAKNGLFFGEFNGKLYYAEYTNNAFEKGVLCRCDVDGKNIEELAEVDDIVCDVTEHSYMLGEKKVKY